MNVPPTLERLKKLRTTSSPKKHQQDDGFSITMRNGITIKTSTFSIGLDPKWATDCDYTFVSHAHIDHVHVPNGKSKIIASEETRQLAGLRGYELGKTLEHAPGVEIFDSGHILGSRALLIKDRLLYTGDLSTRDRAFLKGFKGTKCETLIVESTYGRPRYVFPDTQSIVTRVNKFISQCFDDCRPVILTGYPLGKAQLISYLFDNWEPAFLYDSVYKINRCHIDLGVALKDFQQFGTGKDFEDRLSRGPWLLIAPSSGGRPSFLSTIKAKYNAAVATFTGWAIDSGSRFSASVDASFPLSDHCDFNELVDFVDACAPSVVYTVHGFASEFAAHLRSLGYDAKSLEDGDQDDEGEEQVGQSKLTGDAH